METHVEFRSDKFPPLDGEEKLINPELWGKRLADFLREGLRKQGFETEEPIAEDWGWLVPVVNQSFRLWIGCGHYQEYDDGFLCFIKPHKPFVWRFFKRVDTRQRIGALREAMDKVLAEEEGIRSKRWWTYEEFNHPSLDRMTLDDARRVVIDGIDGAAYKETGYSLQDSDKNRLFGAEEYRSRCDVVAPSRWAEGGFETKMAGLLRSANATNQTNPWFRHAQKLLEAEDSIIGRVIRLSQTAYEAT